MSDIDEQLEALLESNITTSNRRSPNFCERLHRLGREFFGFFFMQLLKIYNLLYGNDRNTQQSRREFSVLKLEIVDVNSPATFIYEREQDDIDQDDRNSISLQPVDTSLELSTQMNEPSLEPARIDGVFEIPTDNGDTMLLLSASIEQAPSPVPNNTLHRQPSLTTEHSKEIAFSYRYRDTNKRVKAITELISAATPNNPIPVFYAPKYQARIAGLNAVKKLQSIYRQAALVVVFLSSNYDTSRFCYNEWRAIKDRFFVGCGDRDRDRLLLIKMDEFKMHDLELVEDDFPVDGTKINNKGLADIILDRWNIVERSLRPEQPTS